VQFGKKGTLDLAACARIGYFTRYAPGTRENGSVYTHVATWAMLAKCLLRRGDAAYRMYRKVCPIYRGLAPERYQARPYITSGNVAGPDSACFGRGSWTWYTGSAAWMLKVVIEGICSVARRLHRRAAVCSRHQSVNLFSPVIEPSQLVRW